MDVAAEVREVVLAHPRGFCAGVTRAIDTVERALLRHGRPVYVFHEIVHNGRVVGDLAARGAVFVDDLELIPEGAVTVFSAHGVSNAVVSRARERRLRVIDATCPLVTKVHLQAQRYAAQGYAIVMIGHAGHEEVEGTVGSVDGSVHLVATLADVAALPVVPGSRVAYVTQTTLSLDDTRELIEALQARYPGIVGPDLDGICYATLNRQNAVRRMAREVELVLVVGSRNSSNSNRLREVASQHGIPAYLVEDATELRSSWLAGIRRVGVTAGASTPELLVRGLLGRLADLGIYTERELDGPAETVFFRLPTMA
jgi:4-hydroxy-3-methylbut-2-enyl diphosphate reductase